MTGYSTTQISKVLNKLYDLGIQTDKDVMNLTYSKLSEFKNILPIERIIILEYCEALKNKNITPFLCSKKSRKEGGNKDAISKKSTTN